MKLQLILLREIEVPLIQVLAAGPTISLKPKFVESHGNLALDPCEYCEISSNDNVRTQHCTLDSEGVIRVEPGKGGIGGRPLYYTPEDTWETRHGGDERLGWSVRPTSAPAQSKPNWIARDKQILVFTSYYQQDIEGSQEETNRIRKHLYTLHSTNHTNIMVVVSLNYNCDQSHLQNL